MLQLLWLVPALPFLGFIVLALFGKHFPKKAQAIIGAGTIGIAALLVICLGIEFLNLPLHERIFNQTLWNWFNIAGFSPSIAFHLDSLSLVFIFVITFVGFLIHVYSVEYMSFDEGYSRFFAYMNLFVGSMLTLVLADNLLLMYLGWEGVGLCSYLLIGFFYKDPANNYAARKAFIVTRIGDTAMLIGLFILFVNFGTLNIHDILTAAPNTIALGSTLALIIALLLLGGAVGKSAQLPLQVWLPDAMAGPSPVSALIHAATMVTAGVYLIARTNVLFALSPLAMAIVAIVGALTLLLAGVSALFQYDLKRVLAYSTISQIGYMFLALGVGAWSAGIFHFMIHAFFKALLFLAGGAVIMALHHEQDMFKMGGLRKKLPVIFWTFLIGSASLSALPLVTAGFYSKDAILWCCYTAGIGSVWFWLAGFIGAFLTAIYTFRMVFLVFYGEEKTHVHFNPGKLMTFPLIILAILTIIGGFIQLPGNFGHVTIFSNFIESTLPQTMLKYVPVHEWFFQILSAIISISGVYLAYRMFLKKTVSTYNPDPVQQFFLNGWNFDKLYNKLFVRPFVAIANSNKSDIVDRFFDSIGTAFNKLGKIVSFSQNGRLNWYLTGIVLGLILTISLMLFL
jgi:NADH-quinone oxidoreductase subunit L